MTVVEADCIDLMRYDGAHEKVILDITDHLEWDNVDGHLLLLQDKLNAYLLFLKSGKVYEGREELRGRPLVINVVFKNAPPPAATRFLETAASIVNGAGIEFRHEVFKG